MSVRKLHWYESKADATVIKANKWNLQLAKPVASGGAEPTYTMIWKSQALAPKTTVSWKVQYALGWTAQVPSEGVSISIEGDWQACNKGESFDIDNMGYWKRSTKPVPTGREGWLSVGDIQYAYPNVLGIHIVIGVLNTASGEYEPIFVDQTVMPPGSKGWYQPQETISWWLESGDLGGSVLRGTRSESTTQDFSSPSDPLSGSYEWSTSYLFQSPDPLKHWVFAPGAPAQSHNVPPPSALIARMSLGGETAMVLKPNHARWLVTFASPMAAAVLAAVAASLYGKLKAKFRKLEISIEGTDGTKLRIVYEPGNVNTLGTSAFLGTAADGPVETIDKALTQMLTSGDITAGETWNIVPEIESSALVSAASPPNPLTSNTAVDRSTPQAAEPNTLDNASAGFHQQQQQSNSGAIVPTHFNEANPNGVQLITA